MNPIVLVLVILLVLENAETGWGVENENDDEDETSAHEGVPRCAHHTRRSQFPFDARLRLC